MIRWLREWIALVVIQELQIGGHCGLCGKWVPDVLVHRYWAVTICCQCGEPLRKKEEF